jgi:disulfide bond formation protein DsbB
MTDAHRHTGMEATAISGFAAATLCGAWFFQYVLHVMPCHLCLMQRYAYYSAVPMALLVAIAAFLRAPRWLLAFGLALVLLAFAGNAVFGGFHAGVEWGFWPGPSDCTGSLPDLGGVGDLLKRLDTVKVVPCDQAAWRLFGVSLAGYNALVSATLAFFTWREVRWCLRREIPR